MLGNIFVGPIERRIATERPAGARRRLFVGFLGGELFGLAAAAHALFIGPEQQVMDT